MGLLGVRPHPTLILPQGSLLQETNTSLLESISNVVLFNDKHFSTAAPVEHHMAKRGFFLFSTLFFPFLNLIKNEIGPKNIERNKFKFTKNCTLSKSH